MSLTNISNILIVYFFISNNILGFDINIEVNKDILFSINELESKELDNKSSSFPSAYDNLFKNNDIIMRHFSLFFWLVLLILKILIIDGRHYP